MICWKCRDTFTFEGYPNRDSTKYKSLYGLDGFTLWFEYPPKKDYCDAWNALVALGITDESYEVDLPQGTTWAKFIDNYAFDPELSLRKNISDISNWNNCLVVRNWVAGLVFRQRNWIVSGKSCQDIQGSVGR